MTKKEVAIREESSTELMFSINNDQELLKAMSKDAVNYKDETAPEDISIPRLRILQAASDQIKKSTSEYVKGAEEGDLFNTLTRQVVKGDEGLLFIPAKRRVVYLEWKDRQAGGGLIANYGNDASTYLSSKVDDSGKRISAAGNEIVKTYDFFGFAVNNDLSGFSEVVISMSKTQAKKAKQFNAMIRSLTDKSTGCQLPEFAGVYKLKTLAESNDKGSWFNYNVEFAGFTLGVPNIGKLMYEKAKALAQMINENSVKTEYHNDDHVNSDDKI